MLNFDWLQSVSPTVAKAVFLVLFVVIGLLVLMIPPSEIYEGVQRPRWWHNLKLWALGVLLLIFATYCAF
jgi:hypothetical protein